MRTLANWLRSFFDIFFKRNFNYKYQRHPFDSQQFFTVHATTLEEANKLAIKHMEALFERKITVMRECYKK